MQSSCEFYDWSKNDGNPYKKTTLGGERSRPVCNQGFRPATDREWKQRWSYHLLFSERHKKYLALPK
jgi:hypothetical protein